MNEKLDVETTRYCSNCKKDKSLSKFYLSSIKARIYKCKTCQKEQTRKKNQRKLIDRRGFNSSHCRILREFNSTLEKIVASGEQDLPRQNPLVLSDVSYLLDNFWNISTLFGDDLYMKNYRGMKLVWWDQRKNCSPWNVVVMTCSQARTHYTLSNYSPNIDVFYPKEIIEKAAAKLQMVESYYSEMSASGKSVPAASFVDGQLCGNYIFSCYDNNA